MILKPRISGGVPYKRKWEYFGAIGGIGLGMLIFFITLLIAPTFTTDGIYEALPLFIRGFFTSINDTSVNNPYYPITIFFIAFVDFPACLAWIIPGILIGYNRNKQYYNVEVKNNGWNVFWHAAIFVELIAIILSIGMLLIFSLQFIPGASLNEIYLSFLGSGVIKLVFFLMSPFYWLGLLMAGLGGFIGTKMAVNKVAISEIVIEEVEAEEVFEEEKMLMSEAFEGDELIWPEEAGVKDEGFGISEVDVVSLKEKIKASAGTKVEEKTIKCSKCGKNLPSGAKFCNACGNKIS